MASVDDYQFKEGLLYYKEHEWAQIEGSIATVGVSDYAQKELGDVVFVELPEVGAEIALGSELCELESTKAVAPVYSPVSGKVIEVNSALEETPEQVNEAPYDSWLAKIELSNPEEAAGKLMDTAAYKEFVRGLVEGSSNESAGSENSSKESNESESGSNETTEVTIE